MENLFAKIILGHLLGDYLLQSKKMALIKSNKNMVGFIMCLVHSIIYTISVCAFLWRFDSSIFLFIVLSHFPIDFWSLGDKWLKVIKGRNIAKAIESKEQYHEVDLIFSCIVYTVVDNSIHIIIMWIGLQYLL